MLIQKERKTPFVSPTKEKGSENHNRQAVESLKCTSSSNVADYSILLNNVKLHSWPCIANPTMLPSCILLRHGDLEDLWSIRVNLLSGRKLTSSYVFQLNLQKHRIVKTNTETSLPRAVPFTIRCLSAERQ